MTDKIVAAVESRVRWDYASNYDNNTRRAAFSDMEALYKEDSDDAIVPVHTRKVDYMTTTLSNGEEVGVFAPLGRRRT